MPMFIVRIKAFLKIDWANHSYKENFRKLHIMLHQEKVSNASKTSQIGPLLFLMNPIIAFSALNHKKIISKKEFSWPWQLIIGKIHSKNKKGNKNAFIPTETQLQTWFYALNMHIKQETPPKRFIWYLIWGNDEAIDEGI